MAARRLSISCAPELADTTVRSGRLPDPMVNALSPGWEPDPDQCNAIRPESTPVGTPLFKQVAYSRLYDNATTQSGAALSLLPILRVARPGSRAFPGSSAGPHRRHI